jgi:hypothetical protein
MIPLNINFLKSQPTVGELRKVVMEAQSPVKITKGDKSFARMQSKTAQVVGVGSITSYPTSTEFTHPLKRTTFNYTKVNIARRNLEWQQAEKELGLIQL